MRHPVSLAMFCWLASTALAAESFPLSPAQECRPRNGLPNFLAKVNTSGADVRIAYL